MTARSFASWTPSPLRSAHSTLSSSVKASRPLRACGSVSGGIAMGTHRDAKIPHLDPAVHAAISTLGLEVTDNSCWPIAKERAPRCEESRHDPNTTAGVAVEG